MGALREVAARVAASSSRKLARGTVDLPLPVFEGAYVGRFGVLDPDRLGEFERKTLQGLFDEAEDSTEGASEFIADACRGIYTHSDGKLEALHHEDGRPVGFDQGFAEALGLELPGGRVIDSGAAVVLACWCVDVDGKPEVNSAALDTFAASLQGWMRDTVQTIEGELVGESQASRP